MIELKSIVEALLFSAQKPLTAAELRPLLATAAEQSEDATVRGFKRVKAEELEVALEALAAEHAAAQRAFRLTCVAGAWQFVTEPEFAPWVRALHGDKLRAPRLTPAALETLTIIAYRQPLTRAEIEQVRGVSVDGVMQTLIERGLIESAGRAEVVGRPMTFVTTKAFLEYFGLRSLEELPAADELRRLPLARPEALVTAEPGLATAPPEQLQLPTPGAPTETAAPAAPAPAPAPAPTPSPTPSTEVPSAEPTPP